MKTVIITLLWAIAAFSQDVGTLERRYQAALDLTARRQIRLDSLNNRLDELATMIDNEKERPGEDRQRLESMMAQALDLTKTIQNERSLLKENNQELEVRRIALYERYTAIIDSLHALEEKGVDQDIQNERLAYAEKRILISESVQSLSFDPKKVQSIRLEEADGELEERLMTDYLENALAEVDDKLIEVRKTHGELQDVLLLREKASAFLQSVDSDGIVGFMPATNKRASVDVDAESFGDANRPAQYFSQVQGYISIASQLELESSPIPLRPNANIEEIEKLSLSEYIKFLDRIEKQLQEYRSVISNKLRHESN